MVADRKNADGTYDDGPAPHGAFNDAWAGLAAWAYLRRGVVPAGFSVGSGSLWAKRNEQGKTKKTTTKKKKKRNRK